LSFSRNGQFILAQGGGSFYSYDFDRDRDFHFETPFAQPAEELALWMDGYRLLGHNKKQVLHIFEFDGSNAQPLLAADAEFGQFFSSDLNGLYSVAPAKDSRNRFLQYTPLLISND
jgi:hypothetical protein